MKVVDEAKWVQQLSEFDAGEERGQAFRDFLLAWADRAEEYLEASDTATPLDALTRVLPEVEENRDGRITIGDIGGMLVALAAFWAHGEAMVEALTLIERRLVQDTVAMKVAFLAEQAMGKKDQ